MLVSNALLIKAFVIGIMLLCLLCDMLCWFANGEHQHLKVEFINNKCKYISLLRALYAIVWSLQLLRSLIVSITKFSIVIGSPRALIFTSITRALMASLAMFSTVFKT